MQHMRLRNVPYLNGRKDGWTLGNYDQIFIKIIHVYTLELETKTYLRN